VNALRINRMMFSELFWRVIAPDGVGEYFDFMDSSQLIEQADYQTGTLTEADAAELRTLADYFRPTIIAEVGTYIGRSTRALARGMRQGELHTCDASNDIHIGEVHDVTIKQYPRKTSTEMFQELITQQIKPDLFYIDGRLRGDDVALMAKLNKNAVILLDDFEGIEKGVLNAQLLLLSSEFSGHMLIYPRTPHGKTAVMLPISMLQLTTQ